jgi:segregation and condensation protein B
LAELQEEYRGRGIELWEVGGGYQFRSSPEAADYVRAFVAQRPVRLTRAQLETLALVAYRQPITRPEIDDVRGVDTGSAVRVLLERGLIKMLGRKDEAGRPLLYGTAPYFLEFFGLASLKDLPTLREFTELTDEHRELFQRKTGDTVEDAEAELAAASESEPDAPPDQDSEEAENEAAPRAQEDSEAEQVDDRDDDIPETLDDASARADL